MKKKILSILLIIICLFMTTGCFEEKHNAQGTMWYVETTDPEESYVANVGDMYLNSTTNDLWQLNEAGWEKVGNIQGETTENNLIPTIEISDDGYWVINGEKTENKAVAEDGKDGADGKDGVDGKDGKDGETPSIVIGSNGHWYIDGKDTGINSIGQDGKDGQDGVDGKDGQNGTNGQDGKDGVDGTSVYVGYDGYIWSGSTKTDYMIENTTKEENILESTIGIEGTMSLYFENGYLDLKNNTVALMSYYKPTAKITKYSGTSITEISVYASTSGKLSIGTAKVSDIVASRTTGKNYTTTTEEYEVTKGLNTIKVDINVAEDETIVLGGNNSVGLFYATGIPNEDEEGVFTLLDGNKHNYLISSTNSIKDKIAIAVKGTTQTSETPIFPTVTTDFKESEIASSEAYKYASANPYTYMVTNYFENKSITKIGIPVKTVTAIDEYQYFTLYILDKTPLDSASKTTAIASYKIYLPVDQLGTSTTVNKWIYVDVKDLNIKVEEGQTLAFTQSGDTVIPGFKATSTTIYNFYSTPFSSPTKNQSSSIYWDIYAINALSLEEHLEALEEKELKAKEKMKLLELQSVIGGKNLSLLGDSITTFSGYSNDATNTNSTIGSNAIYYTGSNIITDVNDTWWKQTANNAGLNVLVNNAWSGDRVTSRGQTRNVQLHDDTGDNAGTNPDIIIVYLGINDYDGGVATTTFASSYDTMISNMVTKYPDADVFLLNFVPNSANSRAATDMEAYNNIVASTATKYNATLVDINKESGITATTKCTYMGDSSCLHPNVNGMTAMANVITKTLYNTYVQGTTTEETTQVENVEISVINATPLATDITQTATLATNPEEIENPNTSTNFLKVFVMFLLVVILFIQFKASSTIKLNRYNN